MRDGIDIAVDLWLPADYAGEEPLGTVVFGTRYGRSFDVQFPFRVMLALGRADPLNYARLTKAFTEAGLAVVIIDARGSGASFGQRDTDLAREEIADYGEVIDWVIEQPWSNGRVGAAGVSYVGLTAEMMTELRHPALHAIAPLFNYFDLYAMLIRPGGVFDQYFMENWSALTQAMDENRCFIFGSDFQCWLTGQMFDGIQPVDVSDGGERKRRAFAERDNPTVMENLQGYEFRDDPWGNTGEIMRTPYLMRADAEAMGIPINAWVGWYDSATADGAIARFLTYSNPQQVTISALSHGGKYNTDPFMPVDQAPSPAYLEQTEQLAAFFTKHLVQDDAPEDVHKIRYYTVGEGTLRTTDTWPPEGIAYARWSLGAGRKLQSGEAFSEPQDSKDSYQVDFSASTGPTSRWHSIGGPDIIYPDRRDESSKLLSYTSEALPRDLEITGAPEATIHMSSTHEEGALHVYLEAVKPDGSVIYITEGVLALKNRAISDDPPYVTQTVYHSFERADAKPMVPGVVEEVVVPLYHISALLKAGDRLRVSIAGADADTFERVPAEGEPTWTVHHSQLQPSFIDLPQRWRKSP